ncbi:MAG: formyl transferase [Acidobacteriota bacterium]|nr:formyl transferase [Acidobacteriota bacterium]
MTPVRYRVLLLCGRALSSNIVYHHLARSHDVHTIMEPPIARGELLRRRLRRLGVTRVAGQLVFQGAIAPLLALAGAARQRELLQLFELDPRPIPADKLQLVGNVNEPAVPAAVAAINPDVVVVNGTRILGQPLITAISAPVVNLHAGITPRYRGVHGGYWALAEGRPEMFGVTLHRVDKGIDTGAIVAQAFVQPTHRDNFSTYPVLQLAAGLSLVDAHLSHVVEGVAPVVAPPDTNSRLWSHPTAWQYLSARLRGLAR